LTKKVIKSFSGWLTENHEKTSPMVFWDFGIDKEKRVACRRE
jgi:hypothetical protein